MTAIVVDTFDRANSSTTLGTASDGVHAWTAQTGTFGIASNQAQFVTYTTVGQAGIATVDAGVSDYAMQWTFAAIVNNSTTGHSGAVLRYQDLTHYVFISTGSSVNPGKYELKEVNGTTGTILATGSATPAAGDVVKIVANGTTIDVYVNGVLDLTGTAPNYTTATLLGLNSGSPFDTTTRWDDLTVTSLGRGWVVGSVAMN